MKKLIIILIFGLVALVPGGLVRAAGDFQTDSDITVNISDLNINITIKTSAVVDSMTVNSDHVSFTVSPGSSVTVESSDRKTLSAVGFSNTVLNCPASGSSQLVISAPASSETGSIYPSNETCSPPPADTSGSSSSSGPSPSPSPSPTVVTPTNTSIVINDGDEETTSVDVNLTLEATDAAEMMISNKSSFEDAVWETFAASKSWSLSPGNGEKMVYAKFKSSSGGESGVINASITLNGTETVANAGQLVKLKCDGTNKSVCTAVYYIGNDGKRYIFPTEKTYYTWYDDFSGVIEISAEKLASYVIGGNITYKPGVRMVKITSDPKVYVITKGGVLREIASEAVAKALYGANWNKQIDDLPDPFFINYKIGTKVNYASDYVIVNEKAASVNVNVDKEL